MKNLWGYSRLSRFLQENWQIAVIFCLALVLRLAFLGLRPFDGDEGIIIKIAQSADLAQLFSAVAKDVHPPLFHFLEFVDLRIFPFNEFWARFPSAVFSALLVIPVFGVFKLLSDKKTALWVSVLTTISAILAYHGAEVRPYALFTFIFFCQFYFLLIGLKKKSFWPIFWFGLFSLLLILTQYIGFVVLVGEGIYVLLKAQKSRWPLVLNATVAVALFALTWGRQLLHQLLGRTGEQSQALQIKNNLTGIFNGIYRFGAGRLFLDLDPSVSKNLQFLKDSPVLFVIFAVSLILAFGLFTWGAVLLYKRNKDNFYLLAVIIIALVMAAAASSEIGPRSVRYLSFLIPFYLFIVLQVYLAGKTAGKILFGIFFIIALAAFINGLYFERTKPGVNVIAGYLVQNAKPGDKVLIRGGYGGGEQLVLRYYLKDKVNDFAITDMYGDYQAGNLALLKARSPIDYINNLKSTSGEVWYYDFTYTTAESLLPQPFSKTTLGQDKEGKDLALYSF